MTTTPEVAFVVQRYGEGITGGSESLARAVAERLAADYRITVFTSCARDYVTWRNELPAGLERLGASTCAASRPSASATSRRSTPSRSLFTRAAAAAVSSGSSAGERSPPLVVPPLVVRSRVRRSPLRRVRAPRHWTKSSSSCGSRAPKSRSSSRPCGRAGPLRRLRLLHLPLLSDLLGPRAARDRRSRRARAHDPRRAAASLLGLPRGLRASARLRLPDPGGAGPGPPSLRARRAARPCSRAWGSTCRRRRTRTRSARATALARPYAIYAGRIDAGKGCAEMLAHHERYRREKADPLDLVLIGRLAMPEPRQPGVRYLGFLPESEKAAALAGARVLVLPEPVREPLDRAARRLRARHARPRQRALRGAQGARASLERRALLRRRRRVRGVSRPARAGRLAPCGARRERPPLRRGRVPLGRRARPLARADPRRRGR